MPKSDRLKVAVAEYVFEAVKWALQSTSAYPEVLQDVSVETQPISDLEMSVQVRVGTNRRYFIVKVQEMM